MKAETEKEPEVKKSKSSDRCDFCGTKLKRFMHNCPKSKNLVEIYGCPKCEDECGFCE